MCGRLRVLSQRMAIAWGMIVSAIAPHKALVKLNQLEKEFERNLARLEKLELAAEFAEKLARIKALWPRYQHLMFGDELSVQRVEDVFELSEQLLQATDALTGHAADLAGLPAAHYVNMAGRNRMLSQRIGKFFLFREWPSLDERIAALTRLPARSSKATCRPWKKPRISRRNSPPSFGWSPANGRNSSTRLPGPLPCRQNPTCPPGHGRRRAPAAQR